MQITVLGSPRANLDDGRVIALPPGRPARLIAYLALEADRIVPHDVLVDVVWDGDPPSSVRNALHVYISRLRALLGADSIVTTAEGYRLAVMPESVDVLRCEALLDSAEVAARRSRYAEAALLVDEALVLHRSPLLAGETLSSALTTARRDLVARCEAARIARESWANASLDDSEIATSRNRPELLGELLGRRDEVASTSQLLERRRLVTLTGAGGIGKTRISAAVRERVRATFEGRVAVIDLATPDFADQLAAWVRTVSDSEPWLLAVESAEQADAASVVTTVLQDHPSVSVLATSRRPLGVPGEVVVTVSGLSGGDDGVSVSDLARSPGVALYLRCASEAGHPVPLEHVIDAARLVGRLDGVPLAIELAARHPDGGRPHLLVNRSTLDLVDVPTWDGRTRHRSLTDSIAWTVERLSPAAWSGLLTIAELPTGAPDALVIAASPDRPSASFGLDELVTWSLAMRPDPGVHAVNVPLAVREYVGSQLEPGLRLDIHARTRAALAELSDELLARPLAIPVSPAASALVRALHAPALAALTWTEPWSDSEARARALLLLIDAEMDRSASANVAMAIESCLREPLPPQLRYDLNRARLGIALAACDEEAVAVLTRDIEGSLGEVDEERRAAWAIDSVFLSLEQGDVAEAARRADQAWALIAVDLAAPTALDVRAARARMHAIRLHDGLEAGVDVALHTAALADLAESTESISAWGEAAEILVDAGELELGASYTRRAARHALRWNSPHSLVYLLSLADLARQEGRRDESLAIVWALLDRVARRGDDRYQKWCLLRLALLAEETGDATRAAVLLGASSTVSGSGAWDVDPDVSDLLERLPASLGGEAFRDAFARGSAAPHAWVTAVLEEQVRPPSSLDDETLRALRG